LRGDGGGAAVDGEALEGREHEEDRGEELVGVRDVQQVEVEGLEGREGHGGRPEHKRGINARRELQAQGVQGLVAANVAQQLGL